MKPTKEQMLELIYEVVIPYNNHEMYVWGDFHSWKICRIGNILKYWLENCLYQPVIHEDWWHRNALIINLVEKRKELDEPIQSQSDLCVKFIFDLISSNK